MQLLIFDHAGEKAFCDGVDVADHTPDKVDEMIEVFHRMFRLMAELDATTVAVVNGRSLGGGCELMAFCDIVVASEKSRIGQPEIAVGVFPPVAAAWFPKIIGLKKTYELLLTGKMISAKEAEAIGLVNVVLPVENSRKGWISSSPTSWARADPLPCGQERHKGGAQRRFPRGPQGVGDDLPPRLYEDGGCERRHRGIHGKEEGSLEGQIGPLHDMHAEEEIESGSKLKTLMEKASLDGAFFHYKIDFYYLSGTMQDCLLFVPLDARTRAVRKTGDIEGEEGVGAVRVSLDALDRDIPPLVKPMKRVGLQLDVLPYNM